ncbi:MAG: hypothetical protein DRI73_08340 [Bacteroidetes bacterium]|nr:MAG: hypothetical protein DRI73_08340 [Bacteroidota bacterium]
MTGNSKAEKKIIGTLSSKSCLKQKVYDHTLGTFDTIKDVLQEITSDFNNQLLKHDERVRLEYTDSGIFVTQLRVAGDLLIFSMHTNIFEFDRDHKIWETEYMKKDPTNSYCGIISIYNFLVDSFKYNRMEDLGYLIARIFINKNRHFFVEGKRQAGYQYKNFGKTEIEKNILRKVIANAMGYSLEFDLLVPPYENVKIASVGQLTEKISISRFKTGKRLGFKFNSDDVLEDK